jgi:hypothetical protein
MSCDHGIMLVKPALVYEQHMMTDSQVILLMIERCT